MGHFFGKRDEKRESKDLAKDKEKEKEKEKEEKKERERLLREKEKEKEREKEKEKEQRKEEKNKEREKDKKEKEVTKRNTSETALPKQSPPSPLGSTTNLSAPPMVTLLLPSGEKRTVAATEGTVLRDAVERALKGSTAYPVASLIATVAASGELLSLVTPLNAHIGATIVLTPPGATPTGVGAAHKPLPMTLDSTVVDLSPASKKPGKEKKEEKIKKVKEKETKDKNKEKEKEKTHKPISMHAVLGMMRFTNKAKALSTDAPAKAKDDGDSHAGNRDSHDETAGQDGQGADHAKQPKKTRQELKAEREARKEERQRKLLEEQQPGQDPSSTPSEISIETLPAPKMMPALTTDTASAPAVAEEHEEVSLTLAVPIPPKEAPEETALPPTSVESPPDSHAKPDEQSPQSFETLEPTPLPKVDWREAVRAGAKAFHVLISESGEDATRVDAVRIAMGVVRNLAASQKERDVRVLGWCDAIRDALSRPQRLRDVGAGESGVAAVLARWLFKLQLAYIRFSWGWENAYKFRVNGYLRHVRLSHPDSQIPELESMQLRLNDNDSGATPYDRVMKNHGRTRLTRANSRGLNVRLDFNYYRTPLPLMPEVSVEASQWALAGESLVHGYEWRDWWPTAAVGDATAVVLDSGSRFTRVGLANEEYPRFVLPSLVATARHDETQYLAGWEAANPNLSAEQWRVAQAFDAMDPDWDAALSMWEHSFAQLEVRPDERPVMLTETPDMSVQGREETLEIMFEYFNVPALYIGNSALMALYGVGLLNGLVVELGQRLQIVPVNNGIVERHAVQQLKKGITNLHGHLAELLEERGYYFQSARDLELVRRMKENVCYLAPDLASELARPESEIVTSYTLPTGKVVEVGRERFLCAELLFSPERSGQLDASFGLHRMVFDAVMKCPIDTRLNLLQNIVLVGGGTLIPGLATRLENEVWRLMSEERNMRGARRNHVRCVARPNRKYLPWKGAATFASMAAFEQVAVTRDDYDEQGKETVALNGMYS